MCPLIRASHFGYVFLSRTHTAIGVLVGWERWLNSIHQGHPDIFPKGTHEYGPLTGSACNVSGEVTIVVDVRRCQEPQPRSRRSPFLDVPRMNLRFQLMPPQTQGCFKNHLFEVSFLCGPLVSASEILSLILLGKSVSVAT